MVNSFNFASLPLIYFGAGRLSLLPDIIKRYGQNIILISNQGSFAGTPAAEVLFDSLRSKNINYHIIGITGEPSPEMIDNPVSHFRGEKTDVVVSVGGGSVIDAGKAISAMLKVEEPVKNFLEGIGTKEHPGTKVPFIAVPTTSGTGSEATKNAVLSETGTNGFKRSLRHDNFVPDVALIDPLLTSGCSPEITAASGMDCFSQLTEAYLSGKSSGYTDALALEGLREVAESLTTAYSDGSNITARCGMAYAALTSGICLANAGLGVVHGFASSVGGLYRIPHGVLCGTLMASANEITVRELRNKADTSGALKKYATLGRIFIKSYSHSDDYYIDGFIDYLKALTSRLDLPLLGSYGISLKDVKEICRITEQKNNPVILNQDDLEEILISRI